MAYIEELFSLKGQRIVLTGGAGAIPGSLAIGFAKAGADLCLWGRGTNHPMQAAATGLRDQAGPGAGRIEAVTVDTADRAAMQAALAETERLIGKPTILVNGVGGNRGKSSFVEVDEQAFAEILSLNIMAGLVTPTRVFAEYWIRNGMAGNVITMTSMASYKPLSGVWAYGAAKAAVLNLTEALAKELAPHRIRVNALAPGFFIGNQNRSLLIDDKTGELTARGKAILAHTPFGRFGSIEELRGAAIFLASDAASGFVSGISLPVDGAYLTDNI